MMPAIDGERQGGVMIDIDAHAKSSIPADVPK